MDTGSVADHLYGLRPQEFTAARDATVKEARGAGERALAEEVKRLRRPSIGAWVCNLLTRQRSAEIDSLLELGAALRAAQTTLAGDDLRRLSAQRRQAVQGLGREAHLVAREAGQDVPASVIDEVQATLEAALADPEAAEALRSGTLTTTLHHSGLGPVEPEAVRRTTTPSGGSVPATPGSRRRSGEAAKNEANTKGERGGRSGASAAVAAELRQARHAAEQAQAAVSSARQKEVRAGDRLVRAQRALEEAERTVEARRTEQAEAAGAARSTRAERETAERSARQARLVAERLTRR